MKNTIYISLITFFSLVATINIYGQEEKIASCFSNVTQLNANSPLVLLNNSDINSSTLSRMLASSGNNINEVIINQIGQNNVIDISTHINTSQEISQLGNNNYYSFIDYYSNSTNNFNVLQNGNSNSLQIYGTNSLINNISIVQKSNFKTIIINNY
jgi:hypothetical protein